MEKEQEDVVLERFRADARQAMREALAMERGEIEDISLEDFLDSLDDDECHSQETLTKENTTESDKKISIMEVVQMTALPIDQVLKTEYITKSGEEYIQMPKLHWFKFIKVISGLVLLGKWDADTNRLMKEAVEMTIQSDDDLPLKDFLRQLEALEELKIDFRDALKEAKMIMNGEIEAITLDEFLNEI